MLTRAPCGPLAVVPGTLDRKPASFLSLPAQVYAATALNFHPCVYDAYGMTIVEAASQVRFVSSFVTELPTIPIIKNSVTLLLGMLLDRKLLNEPRQTLGMGIAVWERVQISGSWTGCAISGGGWRHRRRD